MAHRTWPETKLPGSTILQPGEHMKLPALGRLDFKDLDRGKVKIRYTAVDPIWKDVDVPDGLLNLHDHLKRLCRVTHEIGMGPFGAGWEAVSANLHLACSLTDVFADTDIDGTSMWCGPAADYEDANSEVAVKHLAGLIVFSLVWTAYECAIEALDQSPAKFSPKGARGRDLLSLIARDRPFPFLRAVLSEALGIVPGSTDFTHPDMRRLVRTGHWAGIGGEHLRQFRNRVMHGQVRKPEPEDWGSRSEYVADRDPALRQFHVNIRLTSLLIQILAMDTLEPADELEGWLSEPHPAEMVLTQLHCDPSFPEHTQLLTIVAPLLQQELYL
jgi:hypothetical protein